MQDTNNAKQLVIERIRQSTNILITVEKNPSVDELAAAVALTLLLNKLDKHATGVFSGAIPPAINFLEPGKTFESTVDSLRDFIIALDKEKADRLRYKVEDDVVKIFITPYRATITQKDLEFSQGDFNVELVIALGVENRESLDKAITAHGRILHDATVITINARNERSTLGSIDWQDGSVSSISEMVAQLADALQSGVLDQQISTALLTGIVAATERFSNAKTTPEAMTISAQLMSAGANQQLIANNLQQMAPKPKAEEPKNEKEITHTSPKFKRSEAKEPEELEEEEETPPADSSRGEIKVQHEEKKREEKSQEPETPPAPPQPEEESAKPEEPQQQEAEEVIEHEPEEEPAPEPVEDTGDELERAMQEAAARQKVQTPIAEPTAPETPATATTTAPAVTARSPEIKPIGSASQGRPRSWNRGDSPQLGGTFNATSAQAEEQKRRDAEEARNLMMLSHDEVAPADQAAQQQPPQDATTPGDVDSARQAVTDALATNFSQPAEVAPPAVEEPVQSAPQPIEPPAQAPINTTIPVPEPQQPAVALPQPPPPAEGTLPPLPNFDSLPPLPPLPDTNSGAQPTPPPMPTAPPQFAGQNNGLPPTQQPIQPNPGQIAPTDPNDITQFRIPGQ